MDDRRTVQRMAGGETDALAALYDRHSRAIHSLAFKILRDRGDAEDIVQEVFTQAWTQASRYDTSRGPVVAWLLTMTRTRAIDRARARHARPEAAGGETVLLRLADRAQPADDQVEWNERAREIRSAFESLPLMQRMTVELAFYEGLTHSEIAEHLEVPLGTVKTRIRQALLKMKDALKRGSEGVMG